MGNKIGEATMRLVAENNFVCTTKGVGLASKEMLITNPIEENYATEYLYIKTKYRCDG